MKRRTLIALIYGVRGLYVAFLDTLNVWFYLTLNYSPELTKPKLLFPTRIIPKLSLKSCPPSVANTTLSICYTCVGLSCSAHGCCAVECSVACCAAQHTAITTLTLKPIS